MATAPVTVPTSDEPAGVFSRGLRGTTIGLFVVFFLSAFESLAISTIMPEISLELEGEALYALAFAAALAASVVAMIVVGDRADRSGVVVPLLVSAGVFVAGVIVMGLSGSIWLFIAGRLIQGFGSGGVMVAAYVVVSLLYPPRLHPTILGLFAGAWLLPALVGPSIAVAVAELTSWRWVFLGVAALFPLAILLLVSALRAIRGMRPETSGSPARSRLPWAVLAALAAMLISVAVALPGFWAPVAAVLALVVGALALWRLLPPGTARLSRGLPSAVAVRGLGSSMFTALQSYLPLVLITMFAAPAWVGGAVLTVGAVSWVVTANIIPRWATRFPPERSVSAGAVIVVGAMALLVLNTVLGIAPWVAAVAWLFVGGGMGLVFPSAASLVLRYSPPGAQGANSSAMLTAESTASAFVVGAGGLVLGGTIGQPAFITLIGACLVLAALMLWAGVRSRAAV